MKNMLAENTIRNARELWGKKLAEVPVDLMRIDKRYQRAISAMISQLIKEWDDKKCLFLLVSYRDGVFYIIDGQHRWEAAKARGISHLPCIIFTGLTWQEEARIFAEQNKNITKLTPFDTFKANVACGDISYPEIKTDLELKSICDRHGITVQKSTRVKTLKSVTRGRDIINQAGAGGLEWIFALIESIHWENYKETYASKMLDLFKWIYMNYKSNTIAENNKLFDFMDTITPKELDALARVHYPKQRSAIGLRLLCKNIMLGERKEAVIGLSTKASA